MSEPIVVISHFVVEEGAADELRGLLDANSALLEATKPRTLAFIAYFDATAERLSIVHLLPDAAALSHLVEGAAERSRRAYELMRPAGWEIYGRPDPAVIDEMRTAAAKAGVELQLEQDHVAGFIRLAAG
jgi:hypothetical protein